MTSVRERIQVVAVAGVLAALLPLMLLRRIEAALSRELLETDESEYYLPEPEFLAPLSLGYREAAAGIVWVAALTYFGEQFEVNGTHEHAEQYIMAVTELDPFFYHAYTWGSAAAIYNGRMIDRRAVELSIRLLRRGLRVFPDDGELHYQLGFQYYFELPPVVSREEGEEARRTGADELCTGATLGGGPTWLPLVCSNVSARLGLEEVAQDYLVQALVEAEDQHTRARIEERLERSMTPDVAYRILERIGEQRRRWLAEIPYVPLGLYALLGPRPPVPVEDEVRLPLPMDPLISSELEEAFDAAAARDHEGEEEAEPDASPVTSEPGP